MDHYGLDRWTLFPSPSASEKRFQIPDEARCLSAADAGRAGEPLPALPVRWCDGPSDGIMPAGPIDLIRDETFGPHLCMERVPRQAERVSLDRPT